MVSGHAHHRSSLPNTDIGLYEGHCFYIKNLDVLANHWECAECQQRFTSHNNYERHVTEKRCTGGQPKLVCDDGKFKHIMNSSEKVFCGGTYSFCGKVADGFGDSLSGSVLTFIMSLCGHGGERAIKMNKKEMLVDGYDPETSTVYRFYGCKWHGSPCLGATNNETVQVPGDHKPRELNPKFGL